MTALDQWETAVAEAAERKSTRGARERLTTYEIGVINARVDALEAELRDQSARMDALKEAADVPAG